MKRIQVDISDEAGALLDERAKASGMGKGAVLDRLLLAREPTVTDLTQEMVLRVMTHRADQIQNDLDVERQMREQSMTDLGKHVQDLLQRVAESMQNIGDVYERLECITKTLEPLLGVALRPNVIYNPVQPPKRAWWRW